MTFRLSPLQLDDKPETVSYVFSFYSYRWDIIWYYFCLGYVWQLIRIHLSFTDLFTDIWFIVILIIKKLDTSWSLLEN